MKIIKYLIIIISLFGCQNSEKKIPEKLEISDSISKEEKEKIFYEKYDSIFLDFIDKEIITNPKEKKYISDITKLKSIKLVSCDSMNIYYQDSIDEKQIELEVSLRKFEHKNHKIKYKEYEDRDYKDCELIDGKEPWGGYYSCPKTEIDEIKISVNDYQIDIKDELNDVFDFQMCECDYKKYFNPNPLLKYDQKNKVFFLYVKGGQAADTYFGKFVFDEKKFIKRYLLHYGQLSETGSFRKNFKGF